MKQIRRIQIKFIKTFDCKDFSSANASAAYKAFMTFVTVIPMSAGD